MPPREPLDLPAENDTSPAASNGRVISKFHVPEILFGPGSLGETGYAARRLGAQRAFVVTDPGIIEAGWVSKLRRYLEDVALPYLIWDGLTPNPKDHEVAHGLEAYQASGCDVIVGIGGGSVMDAAKAIGVLSTNGGTILDYEGVDRVSRPIPPLVMVPTTSGTGADVSQFCVITDAARKVKATLLGRALVPNTSLTDPGVLTTMPEWLIAATGIDALTHAIEAYVSRAANSLTDVHALSAMRLISAYLVRTMVAPGDEKARRGMALASLHAGIAFTNALLGTTHALSHAVGGLTDSPHGVINGVLLPHVIRFNSDVSADRYSAITRALGVEVTGTPPRQAAGAVADWVRHLADHVGIPGGLSGLGVQPEHIPSLALAAMGDCCISTNPRPVRLGDLSEILHAAL